MHSKANLRDSSESPHVQSVNATSGGLLKATVGSAIVAGGILVFAWLPAEHGIDPTGVGHLLGLDEMGHIKEQLHTEADIEAVKTTQNVVPDINSSDINLKLDAIQAQLSAIAASLDAKSIAEDTQNATQVTEQSTQMAQTDVIATLWRDEVEYTLTPGQGIEVKLVMEKGAIIEFEWSANGALVNHDTHGDGDGKSISYKKGRSVPSEAGQLTAAFTGKHGWYWRNRTDEPVVVSLGTRGAYSKMLRP